MKSFPLATVAIAIASLVGSVAIAQEARDKVRQAVEEAGQGRCSDVLSAQLKEACVQQVEKTAEVLQTLGPITDFSFRGVETVKSGQAEAYVVTYERAKLLWLATLAPDGRLNGLWSPGPAE